MERPTATVALIGRSNVGKSTLFNRLIGNKKALIDSQAGTTRDRHNDIVFWRGRRFLLIDCGGLDLETDTELKKAIVDQARVAMQKAQVILFVTDVNDGLLPDDKKLAAELRQFNHDRIIVAANKADRPVLRSQAAEFAKLGYGEAWPISAINGSGIGDMLDELTERLTKLHLSQPVEQKLTPIKIALLGHTNVGKSSIANALLGEQRLVVSAEPHTTRNAISVNLMDHGQLFELTDTAGINRHQTTHHLDKHAQEQTVEELNKCDVALLVTDASEPLSHQDRHLAGLVNEVKCGLIIIANKWDLLENKSTSSPQEWEKVYRREFPFLSWVPIAFASALTKQGVRPVLQLIKDIYEERQRKISDNALSRFLKAAMSKQRPLATRGKKPFLSDFKQIGINPPRFVLQVRSSSLLSPAYVRYLQNAMRQKFGFMGTPIHIDLQQATMGGGRVKKKYNPPVRRS